MSKISGRPPVTDLVDYQGFCGFSSGSPASTPVAGGLPSDVDAVDGVDGAGDGEEEEGEEEEGEGGEEGFQRISPREAVARMQRGWAPYVLDVR